MRLASAIKLSPGLPTLLGVLLMLATSGTLHAADKISIRLNVQGGEAWTFDRSSDMQMKSKMSSNGQTQSMESTAHQRRSGKFEVLEVRNGLPTKVRVTFGNDSENSMEMTGQPPQKMPYAFAGQTITVTRGADGSVTTDFRGQADPMSMAELQQALEPDMSMYTDKEIAVGDEWAGNNEALTKQYQLSGPDDRAGMTLKLLSVKEMNGRQVAEIKVSTAAFKQMQGMTSKAVMQGTVLLDVRTGHTLKADLKGTITQDGTATNQGPNGQPMTVKMEGEGLSTISMSSQPIGDGPPPVGVPGANPLGANPLGGNPLAGGGNPLARPPVPGFVGRFSDGELTLDLQDVGGRFAGTIALGGQTYKATGTLKDGVLDGSFDAGGSVFPFTARAAEDTVTLKTGDTTYTLKKKSVNPLERRSDR